MTAIILSILVLQMIFIVYIMNKVESINDKISGKINDEIKPQFYKSSRDWLEEFDKSDLQCLRNIADSWHKKADLYSKLEK